MSHLQFSFDPVGPDIPNNRMSNDDCFILYEHKFLRNIYIQKNKLKVHHK